MSRAPGARRRRSEDAERRAQRGVAVSFWFLAPFVAVQATRDLLGAHRASTIGLGVAVTASRLLVMRGLGLAKRRLAVRLGSSATAGEGTQNLLCAAQALAVLLGLGLHAATGATWADPARRPAARRLGRARGQARLARAALLLTDNSFRRAALCWACSRVARPRPPWSCPEPCRRASEICRNRPSTCRCSARATGGCSGRADPAGSAECGADGSGGPVRASGSVRVTWPYLSRMTGPTWGASETGSGVDARGGPGCD